MSPANRTYDVLVAGAAGFTGALATELMWRHPHFNLAAATVRRKDAGRQLCDLYPHHQVEVELEELDLDRHSAVDAAIVAYPHGEAAPLVAQLLDHGVRVVDLSADFRLPAAIYEEWYGVHPHPDLIQQAIYGLPERYRERIAAARLVAGPGCFPTATLLALAPLAQAGVLSDVVIDAEAGTSGAGRQFAEGDGPEEVRENVVPYKVGDHRHIPEIEQQLSILGAKLAVQFQPRMVPMHKGIAATCYVTPDWPVKPGELTLWFEDCYDGEPFVKLVEEPPQPRQVRDTNQCHIYAMADQRTGKILVFSVIDNLWKGAASQAVQCLNLMFGLPEVAGLS